MAIVGNCVYDSAGRLMPPGWRQLHSAEIALDFESGRVPTFDRGQIHLFYIAASGVTPQQARERVGRKMQRFRDRTEEIRGYREINVDKRQGTNNLNHNTTITYEILYAVEQPRPVRRTSPESPPAGPPPAYRRSAIPL